MRFLLVVFIECDSMYFCAFPRYMQQLIDWIASKTNITSTGNLQFNSNNCLILIFNFFIEISVRLSVVGTVL